MSTISAAEYRRLVSKGSARTRKPVDPAQRAMNIARHEANKAKERAALTRLIAQLEVLGVPPPDIFEWKFAKRRKWPIDMGWTTWMVGFELEGGTRGHGRHTRHEGFEKDIEKYHAAWMRGITVVRATYDMVKDGRAAEMVAGVFRRLRWLAKRDGGANESE